MPQGGLPRSTSIDSIIQTSDAGAALMAGGAGAAGGFEASAPTPSPQCLSVSFASSSTSNSPQLQFLQVHNPNAANSRRESLLSPSSNRRAKPERNVPGKEFEFTATRGCSLGWRLDVIQVFFRGRDKGRWGKVPR